VLRAGVDLAYPPFGGVDQGVEAGIDIDLAAALAERLGLTLELVSVPTTQVASALASGTVDIALGAIPLTDVVLADVSSAGTYLNNGPVFFSVVASESAAATITPEALSGMRVGVQDQSASFWKLEDEFGQGYATSYDTLRAAFDALGAGEVDVVVADAAVGTYIARDYPEIGFAGQYGSAQPIGIAVRKDAGELETQVRSTLDTLASEGVLATITRKWLGEFPSLEVIAEP
jgi:polar amino acid transport system substrate-binding protein